MEKLIEQQRYEQNVRGDALEELANLIFAYNEGLLKEKAGREQKQAAAQLIRQRLNDWGIDSVSVANHRVTLQTQRRTTLVKKLAEAFLSDDQLQQITTTQLTRTLRITPERQIA